MTRRPHARSARLPWLAGVPLALAGAWLCGRAVLGALYASAAHEPLAEGAAGSFSRQAADLAIELTPWNAQARADLGTTAAAFGQADAALAAYAGALRWAPYDARLWRQTGHGMLRAGRFDEVPQLALRRTLELAPRSPDIQYDLALEGLYYWRHGDDELRDAWTQAMRFTLRHYRSRFLFEIARNRREDYFCEYLSGRLYVEPWCRKAQTFRQVCEEPRLPLRNRKRCEDAGFATAEATP